MQCVMPSNHVTKLSTGIKNKALRKLPRLVSHSSATSATGSPIMNAAVASPTRQACRSASAASNFENSYTFFSSQEIQLGSRPQEQCFQQSPHSASQAQCARKVGNCWRSNFSLRTFRSRLCRHCKFTRFVVIACSFACNDISFN
jgi:hypothetical protein